MSLDVRTNFGGLVLRSPIIVGACPLTASFQNRLALESAGAGAIVLPSLFEEHLVAWKRDNGAELDRREQQRLSRIDGPSRAGLLADVDRYLETFAGARAGSDVPLLASLSGDCASDWGHLTDLLQQAGAEAIEMNLHHRSRAGEYEPGDAEEAVVNLVKTLAGTLDIPLFLKLHREYTSVSYLARRLSSGVQGLVLYGRDPEIDISLHSFRLESAGRRYRPSSLSPVLRELLRVYGHCPAMPLTGCGGISTPEDVIKVLLAGADAAAVVSAIYREGPEVIANMVAGLRQFLNSHGLSSLEQLRARRPLEFCSDRERVLEFDNRTSEFASRNQPHDRLTVKADRWGHVLSV